MSAQFDNSAQTELVKRVLAKSNGTLRQNPEAQAAFLTGACCRRIEQLQESVLGSAPFRENYKDLQLSQSDARRLFVSASAKARSYEDQEHIVSNLLTCTAEAFHACPDAWRLAPDEISFYFALGLALAGRIAKPSGGSVDGLTPLDGIHELLSAHPGFRAFRIKGNSRPSRAAALLGRIYKNIAFLRFGAEFDRNLTLLSFRIRRKERRRMLLQLCWHAAEVPADCSTYIHFVDEREEIRFQADYSFDGQAPNRFGILYSQNSVEISAGVPDGVYRVRLGIWSPGASVHLPLTRFRGCFRESTAWCTNAVVLASFKM